MKEGSLSKEILNKTGALANQVQQVICDFYQIQIPIQVGSFIWDQTKKDLESFLGRPLEYQICHISHVEGGNFSSIVYLDQRTVEQLADSTERSRLVGADRDVFASLVEEVSHFVYAHNYWQTYGQKASHPTTEIIGTIDRYNIPQQLIVAGTGWSLTTEQQTNIYMHNIASREPEAFPDGRPAEYILGHQLGEDMIAYLISLSENGYNSAEFLEQFYKETDREKLRFMLEEMKVKIPFFKHSEVQEVNELLSSFNLNLSRENIATFELEMHHP